MVQRTEVPLDHLTVRADQQRDGKADDVQRPSNLTLINHDAPRRPV